MRNGDAVAPAVSARGASGKLSGGSSEGWGGAVLTGPEEGSEPAQRIERHFAQLASSGLWSGLYDGQENAGNVSFRVRLERTVELLPAGPLSVLDVGCGPAPLAPLLHPGSRYAGVDLVDEMLRSARSRTRTHLRLVRAGASLPFRDGAFDAVVALGFVEYLEDIPGALREFGRVVRNGGTVIVSTPKRFHVDRAMVLAATPLRRLAASLWGRRSDTIRRTLLSPRQLDALAAKAELRRTGGAQYHYLPLPYPFTVITPRLSHRATRLVEAWHGRAALSPLAHGYLGRYERV